MAIWIWVFMPFPFISSTNKISPVSLHSKARINKTSFCDRFIWEHEWFHYLNLDTKVDNWYAKCFTAANVQQFEDVEPCNMLQSNKLKERIQRATECSLNSLSLSLQFINWKCSLFCDLVLDVRGKRFASIIQWHCWLAIIIH